VFINYQRAPEHIYSSMALTWSPCQLHKKCCRPLHDLPPDPGSNLRIVGKQYICEVRHVQWKFGPPCLAPFLCKRLILVIQVLGQGFRFGIQNLRHFLDLFHYPNLSNFGQYGPGNFGCPFCRQNKKFTSL
jgi:hypothetical protein